MQLAPLDILQATFSLIFVVISIIIGIKISTKYLTYKIQELLLLGIFWIGITSPWWPNVITFLLILIFNAPISIADFLIVGFAVLPITIIIGLIAFTGIMKIEKWKRSLIVFIIAIPNLGFEILLFYFYFTDLSFIATITGTFTIEYSIFSQIYFIFGLIVFLITGISFSKQLLDAGDLKDNMRGKLLLVAFISFVIGTILDFMFALTLIYVIARLILVSASFEFYMGLIFPEWTRNIFLRE
ncbi:MAG: hypothetical protein EU539_07510 [Promethearchaeota archaeon]|nr:MAG: hypothetical protein EU539_07510 [Candidatus Lokiarchaeota archaeon]